MSDRRRAMVFSGGYAHPFAETTAVLGAMLEARGYAVEATEDLAQALGALPGASLLAVNALRFTMTQHEKYAPFRERFAGVLGAEGLAAIEARVAGGGALLALHTAVICWDDQPGWRELIGGGWDWSRSHHPPLGEVDVALTSDGSRLSNGPRHFSLVDEAYHRLDPQADCTVLATAQAGGGDPQPVAWLRTVGPGRIAVDALGHDRRSLEAPGHRALLEAQLDWLGLD